jgi:CBS domain-containing protein
VKVNDIMTRSVVTVNPGTTVRELATLMAEKRISGVPVVSDDGALVGVVSESDLLHRAELGTEKRRKWWLRVLTDTNQLARDFTKSHGQTAGDVMVRYVVTISPDADLADAADIMDTHRIKRLPVVEGGRLVGILTRGDLVRALVRAETAKGTPRVDNATLHAVLQERMKSQTWLDSSLINVIVEDGVVKLAGYVQSSEHRDALRVLAKETEGVSRVEMAMTVGLPRMIGGV